MDKIWKFAIVIGILGIAGSILGGLFGIGPVVDMSEELCCLSWIIIIIGVILAVFRSIFKKY